jgi:hypothetical protein
VTTPAGPAKEARSYRRLLAMLVLVGETFVVGFATLVAKDLAGVPSSQALAAGGVLALLCVVAAATLRSRVGFALGWLVQALLLASAAFVPGMVFVGVMFTGLWIVALVQGGRADELTARRRLIDGD